jgi:hypothetical protein
MRYNCHVGPTVGTFKTVAEWLAWIRDRRNSSVFLRDQPSRQCKNYTSSRKKISA